MKELYVDPALDAAVLSIPSHALKAPELRSLRKMGVDNDWREALVGQNRKAAEGVEEILARCSLEGSDTTGLNHCLLEAAQSLFPNGVSEERIQELADRDVSLANGFRAEVFSRETELVDAEHVQSALNLSAEAFSRGSFVHFSDHGRLFCPGFQFKAGLEGLERVRVINLFAGYHYPSLSDTTEWFNGLRGYEGLSLADTITNWSTDHLLSELAGIAEVSQEQELGPGLAAAQAELVKARAIGQLATGLVLTS